MSILNELPNNVNITVSKEDLLDLITYCQTNRETPVRIFPEHMSLKQLSEYIGYSEAAIYKMVAQASIPCYKLSGKILFKKTEIDDWLRDFKQPTLNQRYAELDRKGK